MMLDLPRGAALISYLSELLWRIPDILFENFTEITRVSEPT
jgi:hypothetical protein